jgi:YD repeat-containing protein
MKTSFRLSVALVAGVLSLAAASAQASVNYVYDSSGRLIKAVYSNGITIDYRYDAAGNRTQIVTSGGQSGSMAMSPAPLSASSASTALAAPAANTAPVAVDDLASATISEAQAIFVLSNDADADGDRRSVTSVANVTGGRVSVAPGGGHVVYAAPARPGEYSFTYTVSDGRGGTDVGQVSVDVSLGEGCLTNCE